MRRFTIGSAMVLALLLMLTAIATAAPRDCADLPFEHPRYCGLPCWELDPGDPDYCESPPPTTTTTTTTEPSTLEPCPTDFAIEVPKPGRVGYQCLWTPDEPLSIPPDGVEGIVKVASLDGVSQLRVYVRDASPGDICLTAHGMDDQIAAAGFFVGSFDLSYGDLPDDMTWDPTDLYPDFGPYEYQTYWSFNEYDEAGEAGTHWCYPQDDAVYEMRQDLNGPPLHLWVGFKAKQDAGPVAVTLRVEPKTPES